MAGIHNAVFLRCRRGVAALAMVATCAWSAAGCFPVPLVVERSVALDPALLGRWHAPESDLGSLTILGTSETEYLIRFPSADVEARAYLIDVGGQRYLQLFFEDAGFYQVASYVASGDELTVRLLDLDLQGVDATDSATLRAWFLEARTTQDVFGEAEVFTRVPVAPLEADPAPVPDAPQPASSTDEQGVGVEVDLRVGTVTPLEAEVGPVSVGARLAVYPWRNGIARRISFQFVGDYVYRADDEAFDPEFGSRTKITDHFYTLSPAVGADLVRTARVTLEVRGGVTVVGEERTFSLEQERDPADFNSDEFENVCDLIAFRDRCVGTSDATGHLALGLRVRPNQSRFYFGVDYTWLTLGKHQIVGLIGLGSR